MREDTLRALEYAKIIALLAGQTLTPYGRQRACELMPETDPCVITHRLAVTAEGAVAVERGAGTISPSAPDIRPEVSRARRGGPIEPAGLLNVRAALQAASHLRSRIIARESVLPLLRAVAQDIYPLPELKDTIDRTVSPDGEINDHATPELARIRRQKRQLQSRVRDRMDALAKSPRLRDILQEPVVMIREDRYVLPVRQERRSQLDGIIHDRSATGATLFVEPLAVLGMNNALRKKTLEERAEIERILTRIAADIAAVGDKIDLTLDALGRLDLALAAGRLALDWRCTQPRMNERGSIDIRGGRHPLLTGHAVPIDIRLGEGCQVLVITGPNTGGKTVALKTAGLFTLMAQAGLHVPANPGTELAVFSDVLCDIGDEQSIEQSLSTFSSHIRNIVTVVDEAGPGTLVLLDEIGVGTDPREGAALAMAILERLVWVKARAIATTHYDELKTFALETDGMENAAVEFDPDTLSPTYRLIMGVPGASWALEIANRLGMPSDLIDRAHSFLDEGHIRIDRLVRELEQRRRSLEHELTLAQRLREEAERLRDAVLAERNRLGETAARTLDQVRADSRRLTREYRERYDDLLKRADRMIDGIADDVARRERDRLATGIREEGSRIDRLARSEIERLSHLAGEDPVEEQPAGIESGDMVVGRTVRIHSLGQRGEIIGVDGDGQWATVQAGTIRMRVARADLSPAQPDRKPDVVTNIGEISLRKARSVPPEVMLRGLTVEEALELLDSYLDDASLAGLAEVRVIHGKGTGTLRQAVRRVLANHKRVGESRPGMPAEGGDGVTIARLK